SVVTGTGRTSSTTTASFSSVSKRSRRARRMTPSDAKAALKRHSFQGDLKDPRMEKGFLGSLRPYRGLDEANFHEVMEALRVLAPELQPGATVDRDVVSAASGICHFARAWGVHQDGMLRRNGLITPEDVRRLEGWVDTISYAFATLLDGSDVET